mgnify:CR=1 FL=1
MKSLLAGILGAISLAALASTASAETTLTIATVNNGDMIRMQGLTEDFTKNNPDIKLEWVTLEENVLREKVTTDIATKGDLALLYPFRQKMESSGQFVAGFQAC